MKKIALLLLLCIIVYSTGCPKYLPKNNAALQMAVQSYVNEIDDLIAQYECAAAGKAFDGVRANNKNCPAAGASTPQQAQILRNRIIYRLNYFTDMNYNQFIIDLRAGRATTNVLADITELGAGVAGAITNGERAIHIISVALTAFKGGRKSVDLNYFRERTTDVLINQMEASRAKVMTVIEEDKKKDVNDYPLEAALGDLIEYFYVGSLDRALRDLEQNVGTNAQTAKANLLSARGVKISSIPSIDLAASNKAINDKLAQLENDTTNGGALRAAAVIKYKDALIALSANKKAKAVIDSVVQTSGVADVNALSTNDLITAIDNVFALAVDDLELSQAIAKALKIKP